MPFFRVRCLGKAPFLTESQSRGTLLAALRSQGIEPLSIQALPSCMACHKDAASVQRKLCQECYTAALERVRVLWRRHGKGETELAELVFGFFADEDEPEKG